MKKIIVLFLSVLIVMMISVYASAEETEYLYPINCDSTEWKTYRTHDEMIDACNIRQDQLSSFSTEELLKAVLEYPLICDVMLFDSASEGIEHVSAYCTALKLFINREDAAAVLKAAKDKIESLQETLDAPSVMAEIAPVIIDELYRYFSQSLSITSSAYVYTPAGTAVSVLIPSEADASTLAALNASFCSAYPNATFVYSSSYRYNCHSYAWYSSTSSNIYWMNDPSSYMSDGSYTQTASISNASRVYYYSANHSAKVYNASSSGTAGSQLISKWGRGPVMIHTTYYCPYSGNVTLWR